jgi:hypothetical protein
MRSFFSLLVTVDHLLPRKIASVPYQLALETLGSAMASIPGVEVWARNSYRKGNFVFSLSDLDVTVFFNGQFSKESMDKTLVILERHKKVFPFLGESNFYIKNQVELFLPMANFYEVNRDPVLTQHLNFQKNYLELEGAAFLLRHLYADRYNLLRYPEARQKKWQAHLREVGHSNEGRVEFQHVVQILRRELNIGSGLDSALEPLKQSYLNDEIIFHTPMPKHWKFLFPHKHLWREESLNDLVAVRGTPLGEICLRQIEWEVWGLMTQVPYLEKMSLVQHMTSLIRVAEHLNPSSKILECGKALIDFLLDTKK